MSNDNKVRIDVVGNVDGLKSATREAEGELQKLKTTAETSGGGLSSLRVAAEGTGVSMAAVGATVAVAAAGWVAYTGVQVAAALAIKDTAGEMGQMSQRLGISVESLSELKHAATLSDTSLEELKVGLKGLSDRAQAGAPAFKAMGIEVRDAAGNMKPLDGLLGEIADKFAGYTDGAGKMALANDVFGRSSERLIPLLNGGSAGLREMGEEARKLGAIYSGELVKDAMTLNDNLDRLKAAVEGAKIAIGVEMLPTLVRFTEELVEGTKAAGGFWAALMMGVTLNPFKNVSENLQSVRADLKSMEADQKEYGYLDGERFKRKAAQLEYLKAMQRNEALRGNDGVYSNEGRGAGSGKAEAPSVVKPKSGSGGGRGGAASDPLDGLLENYRRDAAAQEIGLSSSTVKEIENLGLMLVRGKVDAAEYGKLLDTVLGKDSVLKAEQAGIDAARKKSEASQAKADEMIANYVRGNALLVERIGRENELALMTEKQRAVAEALYKIDDEGQRLREQIIRDIKDETQRTEALARADAELAAQKERVAAATGKSIDQQRSFEFGWTRAMNAYADSAANAAQSAETLFNKATQSMEDGLVELALTGKLSFKSLADSIIADVVRMTSKMMVSDLMGMAKGGGGGFVSSLLGLFGVGGGMPGSGFGAPVYGGDLVGRASGGPVSAGAMYRVNENGPELLNMGGRQYLMMGDESGSVTPNAGGGGGMNNVINIHMPQGSPAENRRAAGQGAREAMAAISGAGRYR